MREKKHTPGAWGVSNQGDYYAIYDEDFNRTLAVIVTTSPDNEANAKLFAAAPDMLDALIWAEIEFEMLNKFYPDNKFGITLARIQEAIKKAGGGSV